MPRRRTRSRKPVGSARFQKDLSESDHSGLGELSQGGESHGRWSAPDDPFVLLQGPVGQEPHAIRRQYSPHPIRRNHLREPGKGRVTPYTRVDHRYRFNRSKQPISWEHHAKVLASASTTPLLNLTSRVVSFLVSVSVLPRPENCRRFRAHHTNIHTIVQRDSLFRDTRSHSKHPVPH